MDEEQKGFLLFSNWRPLVDFLNNENAGVLFKAIFAAVCGDENVEDKLTPECVGTYFFMIDAIEQNMKKWAETKEKRQQAGRLGGQARSSNAKQNQAMPSNAKHNVNVNVNGNVNVNSNTKEIPSKEGIKKATPRFVPPTLDECRAYWKEKGFCSDPDTFFYFYDGKGWKVGKNPMQKWKSAAAGWENRELKEHPEIKNKVKGDIYDLSFIDEDFAKRKEDAK